MLDPAEWSVAHIEAQTPLLLVIVDTEEEFDWARPLARENVGVSTVRAQARAHRLFDTVGLKPTYVIDYAVASQEDGWRPLKELNDDGRCAIGAHLHPWVNPPHAETVNNYNSYPGNLPRALEREKLVRLTNEIECRFGARPTIYKAGRYGVGPATAGIIEELGYTVDASVVPEADLSDEEGPDFSLCRAQPYWFGKRRRLLELPLTQGYVGWLARAGGALYTQATTGLGRELRFAGMLARTRALERIRLSPEGMSFDEMRRLTLAMHKRGLGVFSFTYHSPSLAAGHTPYTPDEAALTRFLDRCARYFEWFMGELGGRPSTPAEVLTLAR
jgi:hypothetical protein